MLARVKYIRHETDESDDDQLTIAVQYFLDIFLGKGTRGPPCPLLGCRNPWPPVACHQSQWLSRLKLLLSFLNENFVNDLGTLFLLLFYKI